MAETGVEQLRVREIGSSGARCVTGYGSEVTIPWCYNLPDPAPAVGETWLAERLASGVWSFRDKVRPGGFQVLRYAMRLDARACVGRERAVADDVATSGVDGVLLTVADASVACWDSSIADKRRRDDKGALLRDRSGEYLWDDAGFGIRSYGDHVTQLVDRLVANGLWVYLCIGSGLWSDTGESSALGPSQAAFQQVDHTGRRYPLASPLGSAGAMHELVSELKELCGDKVRGVVLDGLRYGSETCDYSVSAKDRCLRSRRRKLAASDSWLPDDSSTESPGDGSAWGPAREEFDRDREAAWGEMLSTVRSGLGNFPVCATVDPQALCLSSSGERVGRLSCGIGDGFGSLGWSMVGMPLDFSRASDEGSEMRSLEVATAMLKRLAGPSTPLYELDMTALSGFESAFRVLNKYGASVCSVGRYEDWRMMPDSNQVALRDAMGSCRVSQVPTSPLVAVVMSGASRDATYQSVDRNNSWTSGLYDLCSTLLDKLPHRLAILLDSDIASLARPSGFSAVAVWMAANMSDSDADTLSSMVDGSVPVVIVGRAGMSAPSSRARRRVLPILWSFGASAASLGAEYVWQADVSPSVMDVAGTSYMLGDGLSDTGADVVLGDASAQGYRTVLIGDVLDRSSSSFPLVLSGRSAYLGIDCDRDDAAVELAGELMLRACSRGEIEE